MLEEPRSADISVADDLSRCRLFSLRLCIGCCMWHARMHAHTDCIPRLQKQWYAQSFFQSQTRVAVVPKILEHHTTMLAMLSLALKPGDRFGISCRQPTFLNLSDKPQALQ